MSPFADLAVPMGIDPNLLAGIIGLLLAAAVVALVRRSIRRSRRRERPDPTPSDAERRAERRLFVAAMIPAGLVWLTIMVMSFIGLTSAAEMYLLMKGFSAYLVPLTLDGVSVSFGFLAFFRTKRGRDATTCRRIVLAGATMSAALNFVHGQTEWSMWAGVYLAFASMMCLFTFHAILGEFEEDVQEANPHLRVRYRRPRFGMRWLLAPLSTAAAWRCWIVHPPAEEVLATVRSAIAHLHAFREQAKIDRRVSGRRLANKIDAALAEVGAEVTPVPVPPRKAEVPAAQLPARNPEAEVTPVPVPEVTPNDLPARKAEVPATQLPARNPEAEVRQPNVPEVTYRINNGTGNGPRVPAVTIPGRGRSPQETVRLLEALKSQHPGQSQVFYAGLLNVSDRALRSAIKAVKEADSNGDAA